LAIYHCSIKIISRGRGKSAVAAAAYRAAETITNNYDGVTHDYTNKRGIIHTEIMLPIHALETYYDRAVLWNAVERIERSKNAQLAREIELVLPVELPRDQNISLVREYVQRHFVDAGMCADLCVHDTDGTNPHAHILLTMRPIEQNGTWGNKQRKEYILDGNGDKIYDPKKKQYKCKSIPTTDWNEHSMAEKWRAGWADAVNAALEQQNAAARVDHRSFIRQGIEQVPTVHMGVSATQMERKGIRTERGDQNRVIADTNRELRQTNARIRKLKTWLYSQPLTNAPTLKDMMNGILGGQRLKSQWRKIADLQAAARVLIFLQNNNISTVEQLADKVVSLHEEYYDVAKQIKDDERRISKLNEHLAQVDIYNKYRNIYQKSRQLDPKKRKAYTEKHADAIGQYESALAYFKDHLKGRSIIPEKDWRAEREMKLANRFMLFEEYYKLKKDIQNVEVLRRGAENMMREIAPERTTVRVRGAEL
jgi:ATP-dependent exoDNAse (exonuclease V) alpha subunit